MCAFIACGGVVSLLTYVAGGDRWCARSAADGRRDA